MKKSLLLTTLLVCSLAASAQTARQLIQQQTERAACNLYIYPVPTGVSYTPAPSGYEPFYISLISRHGSRYHSGANGYASPYNVLKKADDEGKLTAQGKEVLRIAKRLYDEGFVRAGDLTQKGAQQHRGIAARIVQNYPQVFEGSVHAEARATIRMRSAESMFNECWEMKRLCPQMTLNIDASEADMYYMNDSHSKIAKFLKTDVINKDSREAEKKFVHPQRLMKELFNDSDYVKKEVRATSLMHNIFELANIIQNHDTVTNENLYRFFTPDEIYNNYIVSNYRWYTQMAFSPVTQKAAPYSQINMLNNIIQTADTCLAITDRHNLSLRYGHDINIWPLSAMLHLNGCDYSSSEPDSVAEHWRAFEIAPMASNIQFIFYRKAGAPDLVKILLNEREKTIPLQSDTAPYYRWDEFKDYCKRLIAQCPK